MLQRKEISFFDVMKYAQFFPSEVGYFEHDHRFLFSREMGNIRRCKEVRLQKLINSACHYSIRFGIFQNA